MLKSNNKFLIVLMILFVLTLSAFGLYCLKESNSLKIDSYPKVKAPKMEISLPSRSEDIENYILELESRKVPVESNSKYAQLLEKKALPIQSSQKQSNHQNIESNIDSRVVDDNSLNVIFPQKNEDKIFKNAEEEKRLDTVNKSKILQHQKITMEKQISQSKPLNNKFGLQCGAFKNKAQAENMQARLAMAGYNAKINMSAEWNRVVVGPIGDRAAAAAAQSNAKNVAECLIIGM